MSRNRPAFTLIELLVVVSIVAVLISILLPGLAGARNAARNTRCVSNLRQIQVSLAAYAANLRTLPGWCGPGGTPELPSEVFDCPLDRPPAESLPGSYAYVTNSLRLLENVPESVVLCEYRKPHPERYRVDWNGRVTTTLIAPPPGVDLIDP